ncbi:hypothetical protein [Bacteroides neonati]|uniref:hypothetical protein n=1 Tax=Bacteroides neonati TaxID=1347393 RepID=UPI0004B23B37|nr:hypothetical protein [Bacteroides neonati]
MNSQPKYTYRPKGSLWAVYHMTYQGTVGVGTKVFDSPEREEARKECYRLNGWNYKGSKNDK